MPGCVIRYERPGRRPSRAASEGDTLRRKELDALSLYTFFQGNAILVKKLGIEAIDCFYKYCFIVKNSVYFMYPLLIFLAT